MRDKSREAQRYGCKHAPAPAVRVALVSADNGLALRNSAVRAAQLGLGVDVLDGRTYHANDKGSVERIFGNLQWEVLNFQGGYVGSGPGELPGYDPKAETTLTPDALYGIITRYLIDEYPFQPHSGTGMFNMTPMQKLEQVLDDEGLLPAPSLQERRLHLGLKKTLTVTSEGVRFQGVPYNSIALQKWADTAQCKVVTVHLDPDFPKTVSMTIEGSSEILEAHLTMTALGDLTFLEMLEVMERAAKDNPEKRQLHEEHLRAARGRRVMESGFFAPATKAESWILLEKLEKQAEGLLGVEFVPPAEGYRRADIMNPGSHARILTAHTVADDVDPLSPPASKMKSARGHTFKKITKGKL